MYVCMYKIVAQNRKTHNKWQNMPAYVFGGFRASDMPCRVYGPRYYVITF